ncbi:MAG: ribonuclease III [Denitrobacterium sp.]|nr:ribonuclease III [Denitrobacterium sp.]MCI1479772.1 ribonuclease III [Eggerthellaceae bacterium]
MDTVSQGEQREKLDRAQQILGYRFKQERYLLSAITHPSAVEGKPVKYSYERLEFLGDSILGAVVADAAFHRFPEIDEGGLTRIKVALVSGETLSKVADELGFADFIIFGSSERGTGRRGLHSALENVYEAVVAALYLDGGMETVKEFIARTLLDHMDISMAKEPENPKSVLQERLQEDGITPTYKLIETQGPPHDRTFVTQVFAGVKALARGVGRTKKESESHAARTALTMLSNEDEASGLSEKELKRERKAKAKARKAKERAAAKAEKAADKAERAAERVRQAEQAESKAAQGAERR